MKSTSTSSQKSLPIVIQRSSLGCFLIVPFTLVIILWFLFIWKIWSKSAVLHGDILFNCSLLFCFLFGLILWFFGVRTQFSEHIEINVYEVKYLKKGFMRIQKNWIEPLENYKGLISKNDVGIQRFGIETENEIDIFYILLVHKKNKRRNIILEKDTSIKSNQGEKLLFYSSLLNLVIIE